MTAPYVWKKKPKELRVYPNAVNFVKYIAMNPCADPFPVLVETFLPAFLQLWISLSILDAEDVAIEQMRTFPRYGPGVKYRRGSKHLSRKGTPEKPLHRTKLPPWDGARNPYAKSFTTFLFYLTGPLEKIGFAMLFYNAGDRFFYNWTYMLKARRYCTADPNLGPFQRRMGTGVVLFSTSGVSITLAELIQNRGGWANGPESVRLPGSRRYRIILSGEFRSTATNLPGCILHLRATIFGGFFLNEYSEPTTLNNETWTNMFVTADLDATFLVGSDLGWFTTSESAPVGPADARNVIVTAFALA